MWYFNDSEWNMNSTQVYTLTTTALPEEEPEDPPSSGGGGSTTQVQTQYQLGREFSEQGESLKLRKNYQVGFRHQEESHTLTLNSFTTNTAKITIRSDPITATLEKDIAQSFNIDDEEGTDVEITYQGTSGSEAQFFIKKIVEVSGESEVFANSEGGEVQEIENTGVGDYTPQGPSQDTINQEIGKVNKRTMSSALKTILWGFVIIVVTLVILALIGKNSIRNKKRYSEFLDN